MTDLLLTAAYFAVAAVVWQRTYAAFYTHDRDCFPSIGYDNTDRIAYGFLSFAMALFWPPVVAVWLVRFPLLAAMRSVEQRADSPTNPRDGFPAGRE